MNFESRYKQLRRPNACVLILLVILPVLAVATTIDNVTAACTCPYGGQYYVSRYTSLCGLQQNVCITWDNNCANDYPAVCGTTTTGTTRTTSTITTQPTSPKTCSSKCPYGGQYYPSLFTRACGIQTNVCVTWDNNCANDYPACMTTTTSTTTTTRTTSTRCTTGAVSATTSKTCSYTCPYGGQYYASRYTSLCGLQQNVCITWDNNCANDYPAVMTCQ